MLFVAGVWAANAAEAHFGRIDPGPVVIDEVVGMLITTLFLPLSWTGWLVGFVVFRVCDVVKPFPGRTRRAAAGRLRRDVRRRHRRRVGLRHHARPAVGVPRVAMRAWL